MNVKSRRQRGARSTHTRRPLNRFEARKGGRRGGSPKFHGRRRGRAPFHPARQKETGVPIGSQHTRPQFGPSWVPATVFLCPKNVATIRRRPLHLQRRFGSTRCGGPRRTVDDRCCGPRWRRFFPPPMSATLIDVDGGCLLASREGLNALFDLDDLFLGPSFSLKGVNLGCDADFSSQHTSDFSTHPAWRATDPRVHEDMTVFGRRCAGLEMVEEGLLSPKNLNRPRGQAGQSSTSMRFNAQTSSEQWTDQGRNRGEV